ncbi:hypothetical protein CEP48_03245 [Mergibacter septicus]|uniref:Uncharacterized protein n=1 Tax=Mergibacter septicus TaxID=221402 RepID=A0A8D4IZA4_9PAST|nr:contractile injection system protein, VgrG/Pvc8 family [Mergibacter septicus]AWX15239.1 hypothetical protein CEP47_03245 [Mergibacter septicus]QDJ14493.1 hypothetical protein CEP48_03245 [Mergibacter septicus]UTU48071.1 hypothetical protein HLL31_04375 [Mergibacter septicus]WMR96317.1 contractile injection system protein, VgrG/Pvc8 family [Mergibacter septicus]
MNKSNIPTPDFSLFYQKTNITADLEPYLLSISYTDYLEGQSDELSLEFTDPDGKWIRSWFPTQGDKLSLSLGYKGSPLVNLGDFEIDEIEYLYPSSQIHIRALSTGISKSYRTLKPKAYENTTLAQVVATIAKRMKLKVIGQIKPIPIVRVTQYQERDLEFLTRLARTYHHSFKIVGEQLVFTDKATFIERQSVLTLEPEQIKTIRLRDRIRDTVKKVNVSGFDSNGKKVLKQSKEASIQRQTIQQAAISNGDTLNITTRGESQEQINAMTDAALAQQNEDRQAGTITLLGDPKLVAGNTLRLRKLGVFSGKYLITSSRHHLTRSSGFTTEIEVRMLEFIPDNIVEEKTSQPKNVKEIIKQTPHQPKTYQQTMSALINLVGEKANAN